jgi:hypothetical protein
VGSIYIYMYVCMYSVAALVTAFTTFRNVVTNTICIVILFCQTTLPGSNSTETGLTECRVAQTNGNYFFFFGIH